MPESFTGPGFFQLDNVLVSGGVPTVPTASLLALMAILLLGGGLLLRRAVGGARA